MEQKNRHGDSARFKSEININAHGAFIVLMSMPPELRSIHGLRLELEKQGISVTYSTLYRWARSDPYWEIALSDATIRTISRLENMTRLLVTESANVSPEAIRGLTGAFIGKIRRALDTVQIETVEDLTGLVALLGVMQGHEHMQRGNMIKEHAGKDGKVVDFERAKSGEGPEVQIPAFAMPAKKAANGANGSGH